MTNYTSEVEYGIYSRTNSNCSMCQELCNRDMNCGAVECGGDERHPMCLWWKPGLCLDSNSPGFSEYDADERNMYGSTCYKGIQPEFRTYYSEHNRKFTMMSLTPKIFSNVFYRIEQTH